MTEGRGQTGPIDRLPIERRLTAVFVTGWRNGWAQKPPSVYPGSDPREGFDAPDRAKCWSAFLTWAADQPELGRVACAGLVAMFDEEWRIWPPA